MQNLLSACLLVFLAFVSCTNMRSRDEAGTPRGRVRLELVDSFSVAQIVNKDNSTSDNLFTELGTAAFQDDTAHWLAFMSPDSSLIIRRIDQPGNDRTIPLVNMLRQQSGFPSGIAVDSGLIYLYFEKSAAIIRMSPDGVSHQVFHLKKHDSDLSWTANSRIPMNIVHGRVFLRVLVDEPPNQLMSYCDVALQLHDGLAEPVGTLGQYPEGYLDQWVIFRNAYRVPLSNGDIIYGFGGSDSLYKIDNRGRLTLASKLYTSAGKFRTPDTSKIGNLKYLSEYYQTAEQNLIFQRLNDSLICVFKKLGNANPHVFNIEMIGIDANLNTLFEIAPDHFQFSRAIFFQKNDMIYIGSALTGVVKRYRLEYEK